MRAWSAERQGDDSIIHSGAWALANPLCFGASRAARAYQSVPELANELANKLLANEMSGQSFVLSTVDRAGTPFRPVSACRWFPPTLDPSTPSTRLDHFSFHFASLTAAEPVHSFPSFGPCCSRILRGKASFPLLVFSTVNPKTNQPLYSKQIPRCIPRLSA